MLQAILKKQDRYNVRTRVRKFKSRVLKNHVVKYANKGRGQSLVTGIDRYVLRADHSCIVAFKALVGGEKALMYSKGAIEPVYRGYPKFFVTAKSSKSRMGKGKGKLGGRIQKVQKNEAMFELDICAPHRSASFLRAFRSALPVTVSMVAPSAQALSVINEFYRWRRTFNFDMLVASGKKARRQKFILARQKKTVKMNAAKRRKRNRRAFFIHKRTTGSVVKMNMLYNSVFPYKRRNLTKWPKLCEAPQRYDQIKFTYTYSRRSKTFPRVAKAEARLLTAGLDGFNYRGYRIRGTKQYAADKDRNVREHNTTLLRKCTADWRRNTRRDPNRRKSANYFFRPTQSLHDNTNAALGCYIGIINSRGLRKIEAEILSRYRYVV